MTKTLYTIGFTKKSAEEFFTLLKENDIRMLLDIRLNNTNQLAGFTKQQDLEYFTRMLLGIPYVHDPRFAPQAETISTYRNGKGEFASFRKEFLETMEERGIRDVIREAYSSNLDHCCLLCSEKDADSCHRKIVAELMREVYPDLEVIHL
ncbi:MAG TPA: DUF488 domain-containing protein [Clostridiaceae bacterium]|nr:DUF488 domain-containing protein [Clostridiaceae bacterium]